MQFSFAMPTKIYFEPECVRNHAQDMTAYGKKAILLTGRHSAKACGALDDVAAALDTTGIAYCIYDGIENNPSVETAVEAAGMAIEFGADFVVGIGGGSPLDAAKAVAVLAVNPGMEPLDIFKNAFTKALPVAAVPTTAGTGSEVTPYGVLVRNDLQTKLAFASPLVLPRCALLDVKYTMSLGKDVTINTAVDAFSHALEGYLGNRSTAIADCLALEALEAFGSCVDQLINGAFDVQTREKLLYASLLGGIVLSLVGVTAVHGMGYCYTYYKDIPHGRANGLLMSEYLRYCEHFRKDKIDKALCRMGITDIDAFEQVMTALVGESPALSSQEIDQYTQQSLLQKGTLANTAGAITEQQIKALWSKVGKRD